MISIEDIENLEKLARIHIEPAERESLAHEIEAILAYVDQIKQASVEAPEDTTFLRNVFRDDQNPHESGAFTEALLAAAPQKEGQYFKVKKILN